MSDPVAVNGGSGNEAKRERAVIALLSAKSIADAAKRSRIPRRTLERWLAEDEPFQAMYARARREMMRQATAALARSAGSAVAVLTRLMRSKSTPASVRARAARGVLEVALRAVEIEDVIARLDRIEARVSPIAPAPALPPGLRLAGEERSHG